MIGRDGEGDGVCAYFAKDRGLSIGDWAMPPIKGRDEGVSIEWDFGEMYVSVKHYRIKGEKLGSWDLAGSRGGNGWTLIDRKSGDQMQRGRAGFWSDVSGGLDRKVRYIKLTQDKWGEGANVITPSEVEFFGLLFE
jgi:hypothetical protein